MKLLLICGPWSSGTTAVAGAAERMGAIGLGPYFMTNDPDTPNSYESIPFRETVLRNASEPTVSLIPCAPGAAQSGLRDLRRRIEQQEFGPYDIQSSKPIFLKYPLSALLIPEICEVFETRLVYVKRALEDIERTRLRRDWPSQFGAAGAAVIYEHMAATQANNRLPTITIDYTDLLASPMIQVRDIARFADLDPGPAELARAVGFITNRGKSPASAPVASPAPVRDRRQKICLCMIVKDETPVILRCLESVRPVIDYWVIVDTGSTDGTQDLIRHYFHDVPGELHERPWVDFAHNRTEALVLARSHGDYSLIIDADDVLELPPGFKLPFLNADSYTIEILNKERRYWRAQLVRNAIAWRYEGVLHEFLSCTDDNGRRVFTEDRSQKRLPGARIRMGEEGARRRSSSSERYRRDALVLETALATETDPFLMTRYKFYYAQSLENAGETQKALQTYLERSKLGGWNQEVFISLFRAANIKARLDLDAEDVIATYLQAHAVVPGRAEALYGAARFCRFKEKYQQGYDFAKRALQIRRPDDGLFLDAWIYDHGLLDEYSVNAYWIGRYADCLDASRKLLASKAIPEKDRARIQANADLAAQKLREPKTAGARHVAR